MTRWHFALIYPAWALLIYGTALPGLLIGLAVAALRSRRGTAYLGEWPDDAAEHERFNAVLRDDVKRSAASACTLTPESGDSRHVNQRAVMHVTHEATQSIT